MNNKKNFHEDKYSQNTIQNSTRDLRLVVFVYETKEGWAVTLATTIPTYNENAAILQFWNLADNFLVSTKKNLWVDLQPEGCLV